MGINSTMDQSVRRHKVPMKSIRRNLRISRIRSVMEHPYAFFKRMLHFGHAMVTTVQRVRVKTYFTAMCYNLVRARFLNRIALSIAMIGRSEGKTVKHTMFCGYSDKID